MRRTALLAGVIALALAAPASASKTVGSNLSGTPDPVGPCLPPATACALANTALPAGHVAADGVASPIDGVVVGWSVKSGSNAFSARLRVIRSHGVVVLGDTVSINTSGTHPFPAQLSINAGDIMAVDVFNFQPFSPPQVTVTGPPDSALSFEQWNNPPDQGDMGSPMTNSSTEVLVSAVVEPDADHDGYGDESQDGCPTDASTHGPCPPPPPPPPNNTGGTTTTPGSGTPGGTGGTSEAGGGTTLGGALPNGPPIVTAPPPLPTPKSTKKAKRCKRPARGHRAKRCPKKKRPARRR